MALKQLMDTSGKLVTVDVPRRRKKEKKKNGHRNGKTWSIGKSITPLVMVAETVLGRAGSSSVVDPTLRSPLTAVLAGHYEEALKLLVDNAAYETVGGAPLGSYGPASAPPLVGTTLIARNLTLGVGGLVAHKIATRLGVNARIGELTKMVTGERVVV